MYSVFFSEPLGDYYMYLKLNFQSDLNPQNVAIPFVCCDLHFHELMPSKLCHCKFGRYILHFSIICYTMFECIMIIMAVLFPISSLFSCFKLISRFGVKRLQSFPFFSMHHARSCFPSIHFFACSCSAQIVECVLGLLTLSSYRPNQTQPTLRSLTSSTFRVVDLQFVCATFFSVGATPFALDIVRQASQTLARVT